LIRLLATISPTIRPQKGAHALASSPKRIAFHRKLANWPTGQLSNWLNWLKLAELSPQLRSAVNWPALAACT